MSELRERALAKLRRIMGGTPDELSASDARALLALLVDQPEPVGYAPYMEDEDIDTREGGMIVEAGGRLVVLIDEGEAESYEPGYKVLPLYAPPMGRTPGGTDD